MKIKYFLHRLGDNYAFRSIVFGARELLPLSAWRCAEELFKHSLIVSNWWIRLISHYIFHPPEVLPARSWDLCPCGCIIRFLQVLELLERHGPEQAHSNLSLWDFFWRITWKDFHERIAALMPVGWLKPINVFCLPTMTYYYFLKI